MNLDVELVRIEANHEGELLMTILKNFGLARTLVDAVSLISSGAVLVNGQPMKDLNYRLPETVTIVVGLHGIELAGERKS